MEREAAGFTVQGISGSAIFILTPPPRVYSSAHKFIRMRVVLIMRTQEYCRVKMGQSGSSSAAVSVVPAAGRTVSRYVATFKKLYRELIGPDETGEPANDDLFRVRAL